MLEFNSKVLRDINILAWYQRWWSLTRICIHQNTRLYSNIGMIFFFFLFSHLFREKFGFVDLDFAKFLLWFSSFTYFLISSLCHFNIIILYSNQLWLKISLIPSFYTVFFCTIAKSYANFRMSLKKKSKIYVQNSRSNFIYRHFRFLSSIHIYNTLQK